MHDIAHQIETTARPVATEGLVSAAAKRALDIFGAVFGLVVLSPLFAVVAVLIRLDSPGPALFTQVRLGRNGAPFTFYKFRSMCVGNDCTSHRTYVERLIRGGGEGLRGENGSYKIEADPRVTRVGHVLRRTSIDELPQLYNVLRGEMSLVGPRPPLPYEAELYTREQWRRLEALPGMTGLWQVSGRAQTTFDRMVELDIEYAETRTLWTDLSILARTVTVVLDRKGAW